MERLTQDIKNKNFRHFYLLYGEEAYLRRYYMKSLKEAIIGDDSMNYTYFEGAATDPLTIKELSETLPFFSERRLIVLENTSFLKKGGEELAEYFKNAPDYLYVIMSEAESDKRSKLFKFFSNNGTAVAMEALTGPKQLNWIGGILKKDNKRITTKDAEYLISLTGDDMLNIKNELEKLINYLGDRDTVTKEDIDAIVTRQVGDHIFKMVDAMGQRNQKQALTYYYDLLAKREPAFKILTLIARQYNLLLQTRELMNLRYTDKDIAAKIKVNPYFLKNYKSQAMRYEQEGLKKALEACVNADESIKSGKMTDKLCVELLIVELSK